MTGRTIKYHPKVYPVTKQTISKARLTPREELVMNLLADGLSVKDIIKTNRVLSVIAKKPLVSRQQIHNIKNRATGKILRQNTYFPDFS